MSLVLVSLGVVDAVEVVGVFPFVVFSFSCLAFCRCLARLFLNQTWKMKTMKIKSKFLERITKTNGD